MRTVVLALAISLAVQSVVLLPLLPEKWLAATPVTDIHYDAGETIGWPALAATVGGVSESVPDGERVAVLARNYGEAGAVDHFLPALGPAHSGHNAYWDWGPPADTVTAVIVIGYPEERVRQWFGRVELAARVDNGVGVDNDEQGAPIWSLASHARPGQSRPQLRRGGAARQLSDASHDSAGIVVHVSRPRLTASCSRRCSNEVGGRARGGGRGQ